MKSLRRTKEKKDDIFAQKLALYILPMSGVQKSDLESVSPLKEHSILAKGRFVMTTRTVEGWMLCKITLSAVQLTVKISEIPSLLAEMLNAFSGSLESKQEILESTSGNHPVAYMIVHIQEVGSPPSGWRLSSDELLLGIDDNSTASLYIKMNVRSIIDTLDPLSSETPRGYYYQYDEVQKKKGYLAVGPHAAVCVGISDKNISVLSTLLQSGTLAPSGGFTTEGFNNVIARITQWTLNQDIRESIDQINAFRASGDAATRGQIGLTYSIALIGITLSIISYIPNKLLLLPGMLLAGFAGISWASHAGTINHFWKNMGIILFIVSILLTVGAFLVSFLSSF